MHEALRHAVSELKSYFPYDTISATQVGFSTVQMHMPEESLNDLVFLLSKTEDITGLRDELTYADKQVADLTQIIHHLRGLLEDAEIEVSPPRV